MSKSCWLFLQDHPFCVLIPSTIMTHLGYWICILTGLPSLTVPLAAKKNLLICKSHCTPFLPQTLQWCPLHLFRIVYKVLCKLVLVISLTFSLTLSSLIWFLNSHTSFLALPWNVKCALIPGPLHMLFPLPSTLFLQIFTWLTPSLPQSLCPSAIFSETPPWPLCTYMCSHTHTQTHKGQIFPFLPHPLSHTLHCFPYSIYCHPTYHIFTFPFVYFLSLPLGKKVLTWSGADLCSLLYLQYVEQRFHKVDVQLIYF